MNVINELNSLLGPFYYPFTTIGMFGMIAIPVLTFFSMKGYFIKASEEVHSASQFFFAVGKVITVFSVLPWVGAIFSIFPGIFFCSIFCFVGLALPILGISTTLSCLFLIFGLLFTMKEFYESA